MVTSNHIALTTVCKANPSGSGMWGHQVNIQCTDIREDTRIKLRKSKEKEGTNSKWWHMPAIPTRGKLMFKGSCEVGTNQSYKVTSGPSGPV